MADKKGRPVTDGAYLYILKCADGSYYVGTARATLEQRVAEHNAGHYDGYTATRRPVTLLFSQWFGRITDAIAAEQRAQQAEAERIQQAQNPRGRTTRLARGERG